jgi:hypothetical protein
VTAPTPFAIGSTNAFGGERYEQKGVGRYVSLDAPLELFNKIFRLLEPYSTRLPVQFDRLDRLTCPRGVGNFAGQVRVWVEFDVRLLQQEIELGFDSVKQRPHAASHLNEPKRCTENYNHNDTERDQYNQFKPLRSQHLRPRFLIPNAELPSSWILQMSPEPA